MRKNKMRTLFVAAVIAAMLALPAGVIQAALTWDADGATSGQTDGAGAWLDTGQWWDGSTNVDWASGSDADFGLGGTGGAVTLASPTAVGLLTMNSFRAYPNNPAQRYVMMAQTR